MSGTVVIRQSKNYAIGEKPKIVKICSKLDSE